jgi:hypothetical protein
MLQDVAPVVFRNGQAESAVREFYVQISRVQQQIGAVQRHAETNVQESRSRHRNPCTEIPMVHMDMCDPPFP